LTNNEHNNVDFGKYLDFFENELLLFSYSLICYSNDSKLYGEC